MVKLLQLSSSSGAKVQKKRKLWICVWFLVSGLIQDTYCNLPQASSQNGTSNSTDKDPSLIHRSEESSNGTNRKQRAVPPRIRVKIPKQKDDIEKETLNDEALGYVYKIPIHIIMMEEEIKNKMAPGPLITREIFKYKNDVIQNALDRHSKRNTVIPMARFGRSNENIFYDKNDITSSQNLLSTIEGLGSKRRNLSDSSIPHPRFGRSLIGDENTVIDYKSGVDRTEQREFTDETQEIDYDDKNFDFDIPETKSKREDSDYVLPQIRYGRSMIFLTSSKSEKSSTEKPHTFILPYPRPGRRSEDSNTMIPYPRPGRSNDGEQRDKYKRQGYMVPSARLGRTAMNSRFENNNLMASPESFLGLKVNPLYLKNTQYKTKEEGDNNSNFVIPYPRPGKKASSKVVLSTKTDKAGYEGSKQVTDYVLPYPRPGRADENDERVESYIDLTDNILSKQSLELEDQLNNVEVTVNEQNSPMLIKTKSDKNTMIPYARLGENYNGNLESDANYFNFKNRDQLSSENFDNEYNLQSDGLENYSHYVIFKRSNSVVPYPRIGRSDSVVPYPRPGRSNSVVPYPRLGRSSSVVPYPRLGRSNSVVPYPRMGKSISVVPYPRPEHSNLLVPYPRPGRAISVVPYPTPGRSNSIVPNPRFGRSNSESLYSVVPYPRPGRSDSMVSTPGFGRSNIESMSSVVQYPRTGMSNNAIEMKDKASQFLLPNIRPGKRESYVLTYPGPGKTVRKDDTNLLIPYPRPGRSDKNNQGYVLPHPRIGRSDEYDDSENVTVNTVIPYPRLGRTKEEDTPPLPPDISNSVHKLNKHMLNNVDDSIYLLPYPRPGRISE